MLRLTGTRDEAILAYVREHHERFLRELKAWVAVPSISADPAHAADVRRSAEGVAERLREAGMERAEVLETGGHPVAYAEWLGAPGKPTILIYGHHDVQPAAPLDLWRSPPFAAEVRDGKIYGRGVVDDKTGSSAILPSFPIPRYLPRMYRHSPRRCAGSSGGR